MANHQPTLRFDHREIAVIFSLFIFVSLLMFTVGILVGKGLAQAKYEGNSVALDSEHFHPPVTPPLSGGHEPEPAVAANESKGETKESKETEPQASASSAGQAEAKVAAIEKAEPKTPAPLELVPATNADITPRDSLQEPIKSPESEHILHNPKIRALIDDDGGTSSPKRAVASVPKSGSAALPHSFAKGKYTVQVGSYPTEKDATERVETLKKLGFPYAYFSAKQLSDKKDIWYRVWLGYFPDSESAQQSGKLLQDRGEVKNYLVRKTETTS